MSKAFTRESDDAPDLPLRARAAPLPVGAKNYLTQEGAQRFREELARLLDVERPKLARSRDELDAKEQLRLLDERINSLQQIVQTATVVSPPSVPGGQVRFGATVTVRDRHGTETEYRIVGVDETDVDRGWVSWLSPIARALLKAKVGDRVRFQFPSGEEQLEVIGVRYH